MPQRIAAELSLATVTRPARSRRFATALLRVVGRKASAESLPWRVSVPLAPATIQDLLLAEKPSPNSSLLPPRRGRRRGPHSARIDGRRSGPPLLWFSRLLLPRLSGSASVQPCRRRSQLVR